MWFECTGKYNKIDENGKQKKVAEKYLFDTVTFGDAEKLMSENMSKFAGEFEISAIKKENYSDVFQYSDGEFWYLCKISYIDIDDNGKEKKVVNRMLVNAESVQEAHGRIIEKLQNWLMDYKIEGVDETKLIGVFFAEAE